MTAERTARIVDFDQQTTAQRVVGLVVGPVVLGAVSGLMLGWTAIGYWMLQVIAVLGGIAGGFEHHGATAGLRRGALGGLVYGASLLLAHAVAGTHEHVSLGSAPGLLPIVTTVIGSLLGTLGGARRAARG